MRIALVGLGYWGSKLLRNLVAVAGDERVVVVEPAIDRLAAACAEYPNIGVAPTLQAALDDPHVGAVMIATPAQTHARLARQALDAGRHVFVEKPLTDSVADAVELVRVAEQRGLVLMVGHTFLFSPRVDCIAEYVQSGRLGRVQYVTSSRLNLGPVRTDTNVIWDLGPHDLSIVFRLLDEFPVSAQTMARCILQPGIPDVAFVSLQFPSGTVASLTMSWLAPRKVRNTVLVGESRMVVYDDADGDEPVKIYDKGILATDSSNFGEHQLTYRYGDTIAPHVPAHEPLGRELSHFVACIDGHERCRSDGWFGLRVVEALSAADASWRCGGEPVFLAGSELEVAG